MVTQYADPDSNAVIEGFNTMFVPYGHAALAEAAVASGGTPATATYNYLAQDHLGTGRFVYNQAKTQTAAVEHYPYGERYSVSGTAPYHEFTGKPWDADASMFYFPYRYYRPDMDRWTTPDPAGLIDGPNVYGYVKHNPARTVDMLGLFRIKGDCNGKENEIRNAVESAYKNLDNWVTSGLKSCLAKRCKNATIRC